MKKQYRLGRLGRLFGTCLGLWVLLVHGAFPESGSILIPYQNGDITVRCADAVMTQNGLALESDAIEGLTLEPFHAIMNNENGALLAVVYAGGTHRVYDGVSITHWLQSGESDRRDPISRQPICDVAYYLKAPSSEDRFSYIGSSEDLGSDLLNAACIAIETGNEFVMNMLGTLYEKNNTLIYNPTKARYWYSAAAALGNTTALNNLGTLYYYGFFGEKNEQKAYECYMQAARQGNVVAVYNLASLHLYRKNAEKDYRAARHYYKKAAYRGCSLAMLSLGLIYKEGYGVQKKYKKARYWLAKAAKYCNESAMYNLGLLYAKGGYGLMRDINKAQKWFRKIIPNADPELCAMIQTELSNLSYYHVYDANDMD